MSVVKNPQKVYVGNLPRDVTEHEIEKIFRDVGKVLCFEFKGDFAFVEYEDANAAEEAVKSLDRLSLHGRKLIVEPFRYRGGDPRYRRPPPKGKRGQYRLIISGINSDSAAEDLRKWAETEKLHSIALTDVYNRHGMSEGVIEFLDQEEFDTALRTLDGLKFNGHSVRVCDERDYNRRKLRAYGQSDRGRDRDRSRGRGDRDRGDRGERDRYRDGDKDFGSDHGNERRRRDPYGGGETRDRYPERDYHDREESRNNTRRNYRGENGYNREPRPARSRSRDNDRYRERSRDQNKEKETKKSRSRSRDKKDKERDQSREKKKDHDHDHDRERERDRPRERDPERDRSGSRSKEKKKKETSREKGRSGSRTKGRSRS